MRVGIAIDVSTDVSHEFIVQNGIHVLPSTIHMGDESLVYDRDPEKGLDFYRHRLTDNATAFETTPFSVKEIEDLFLQQLVLEYDYVFLITLTSNLSLTYENAHKASFTILQSYTKVRAAHRVPGPFALRVVDSQSLFAGPGVLAWEAVRMARENRTPVEMRKHLDDLVPHLYAYLVPRSLFHIRTRANERGDRSVGWLAYLIGKALDVKPILKINRSDTTAACRVRHFDKAVERMFLHGAAQIRRGLLVPMVGVSYGGDPVEVRAMPGFAELTRAAQEKGVEVMVSMMAPAAAVNVGGGGVSLAYCARDAGEFEG